MESTAVALGAQRGSGGCAATLNPPPLLPRSYIFTQGRGALSQLPPLTLWLTRGAVQRVARSGSMREMSSQFKDMRASIEEDEDLSVFMAGLRGTNIDDSDFAGEGVSMMLVTVRPAITPRIAGTPAQNQLCPRLPHFTFCEVNFAQ